MRRFPEWLWRRHRAHFPLALGVMAELAMVVLFMPVGLAALSALLGLGGTDTVLLGAIAAPLALTGPLVGLGLSVTLRRTLRAWGRGDHSDPVAAWTAAVHAPPRWSERATLGNLLVLGPTILWFTSVRADLTAVEVACMVVMVVVFFASAALVIGIGFQLLLRPMLDEIAREVPLAGLDSGPARWSLRGRFHVAIASACFLTGIMVSAAVGLTDTRESALVVCVVISGLTGAYMVLLFGVLLVHPTLRPIGDLTAATIRVRLGDFGQAVPVTTADEFGQTGAAFNDMLRGLREREALHSAFASYVDPGLAQRLLEQGSSVFEGEELEVTVMFADVRGFTKYAESASPREAVERLNQLYETIVPVLHHHGGHANHYLGDGLLAVFGAPQPLLLHADAAVRAAVQIQQRVRTRFAAELRLGIGINTGQVIAGTVGGGGRHEFTVIGDAVNVAARVEQLTKDTGDAILITEATRLALSPPRPRTMNRGEVELRGKASKLTLHAVNPVPRSAR